MAATSVLGPAGGEVAGTLEGRARLALDDTGQLRLLRRRSQSQRRRLSVIVSPRGQLPSVEGREVVQVPVGRQRRLGDLAEPADHVGHLFVVAGSLRTDGDPPVSQPALDVLETTRAEQLLQQLVPIVGTSAQEGLEPALGQHRDLGELRQVHADKSGDQVAGLVDPARQRLPLLVGELGDRDAGLLHSGARAALLRALPRGGPHDAEAATRESDVQSDPGDDVGGRLVGSQPLGRAAVARHIAVEREADSVEHARLASSGGAGQQEEPGVRQVVEVNADRGGERAKGLHVQLVKPHGTRTRVSVSSWQQESKARSSSLLSSGDAGLPRSSDTKSRAMSRSLRGWYRLAEGTP